MPSRFHTTFALLMSALQTGTLLAHPGHGTTDPQTAQHYAVEPLHALPWIAAIVVAGVALMFIMRLGGAAVVHRVAPPKPQSTESPDR